MRVLLPSLFALPLFFACSSSTGPNQASNAEASGSSTNAGGSTEALSSNGGNSRANGGMLTGGTSANQMGTGGSETGGTGTTAHSGGTGAGGEMITPTTGGTNAGDGSGGTSPATGGASSSGDGCGPPDSGTNPNRVCIKGKNYYLNGINVAWDQWTTDLTNYDAAKFESLFATLESSGGNAIRWWWFIDGENQLSFQGNLVQPLSQVIFDNLDQAFDAAAAHGVLIMPVLLSFDITSQGREFLLTDEAATDAFVSQVVTPLVSRYNDHPGLGLWEIMNEGDWLLTDEDGAVSIAHYQRFHAKVAAGIHAADEDALVTTGSASFKYLADGNNILADDVLLASAGGDPLAYLNVYQTHYYSWMHGDGWSYEPWTQTSSQWQSDGKPILIGEFACKGEEGRWSGMQMHLDSVAQGYAGTFCWAYFDNRADDEGTWADAQPGIEAIATEIPNAIVGE